MFLLQEFNIEIRDKKGVENLAADHLSWIERENDLMPIRDEFPYEQLMHINTPTPWCILDAKINLVLQFCHVALGGNHYGSTRMTKKVLDCGFYWPIIFRDAHQFVSTCEKCQKARVAINRRHEMHQQPILFCKVFMCRVEAISTKTNDAKVIVDFLKSNIFYRFGVLKVLISDQGSHFYNRAMSSLLHKYEVVHRIAITYHPQTNDQAEVFNREIKKILQKMTNPNRKD
ncbi:Gag-Pol polyprotein, partial [Mucuna pruriens]